MTYQFYLVKSIHIALLGIYYFIISGLMTYGLEALMPNYDERKYSEMGFIRFFLELLLYAVLISLMAYLSRNIVERIPAFMSRFDSTFDPSKVKELNGGIIIVLVIVYMQVGLKQKLTKFIDRFMPLR